MRVAVQPVGSPEARQHYADTMERPVPMATLARFLSARQMQRMRQIHGRGPVPTWGVTPGVDQVNKRKWNHLAPGMVVLFAASGYVQASATVSLKVHSSKLARLLWKKDKSGQTWEYMYFLTNLEGRRISVDQLRLAAGFKPGFRVQGFQILKAAPSERLRNAFSLETSTPDAGDEADATIVGDLDRVGTAVQRREQQRLKQILLKGSMLAPCGLCRRILPREFLVAGHIKKRACCTDGERRDLKNVAMLMCKLGCDELYERGFLCVRGGVMEVSPHLPRTKDLRPLLKLLEGRHAVGHTARNAGYFAWHTDNVFKAGSARLE